MDKAKQQLIGELGRLVESHDGITRSLVYLARQLEETNQALNDVARAAIKALGDRPAGD